MVRVCGYLTIQNAETIIDMFTGLYHSKIQHAQYIFNM